LKVAVECLKEGAILGVADQSPRSMDNAKLARILLVEIVRRMTTLETSVLLLLLLNKIGMTT